MLEYPWLITASLGVALLLTALEVYALSERFTIALDRHDVPMLHQLALARGELGIPTEAALMVMRGLLLITCGVCTWVEVEGFTPSQVIAALLGLELATTLLVMLWPVSKAKRAAVLHLHLCEKIAMTHEDYGKVARQQQGAEYLARTMILFIALLL